MAHLPSYKSFNFHDVEEIEQRIFCPTPTKSDQDLKMSPGSLNIQDEMNRKAAHHENIHHSSKWDNIQHSIYNILHHKPKDSLVVHVNENFSEETIEESSEDESIVITHAHTSSSLKKKKEKRKVETKIRVVNNATNNLEIDETPARQHRAWECLVCCRSRS